MDKIINYLLLTIIFVFDPLAIALVVAANFAFAQIKPKTKENLYGEIIEVKEEEEDDNDKSEFKENYVEEGYWKDEKDLQFKDAIASPISDTEDFLEEPQSISEEDLKEYQKKYPMVTNVIKDLNSDGVIDEKDQKIYDEMNKKKDEDDDLIIKY